MEKRNEEIKKQVEATKEGGDEQVGVKKYPSQSKFDLQVTSSYIMATVFAVIGFYKMFVYESGYNSYNYYVGGDAYNYIINANLSIAYFILALMFVLIACTLQIKIAIKEEKSAN